MGRDSGGNELEWVLAIEASVRRAQLLAMSAPRSLALILVSAALVGLVAWWGGGSAPVATGLSAGPLGVAEEALVPPGPGPELAATRGGAVEAAVHSAARREVEPGAPGRGAGTRAGWPRLTVHDPSGAPLEGARASWRYSREREVRETGGATRLTTSWTRGEERSNSLGQLRLGIERDFVNEVALELGGYARRVIGVARGEGAERKLVLEPLLLGEMVHGYVVFPDGRPAGDVQVKLGTTGAQLLDETTTDPDGWFGFTVESPGASYFLTLAGPVRRFLCSQFDGIRAGPQEHRLVLARRSVLRVAVEVGGRKPTGEVQVVCEVQLGGGWLPTEHRGLGQLSVGWALPAVPFRFLVRHGANPEVTAFGPYDPDRVGAELTLELPGATVLRGTVLALGAPLAGATVAVVGGAAGGPGISAVSDSVGHYLFEFGPERSTVQLRATHPDYGTVLSAALPLSARSEQVVDLEMGDARTCALRGRVLLPDGLDPTQLHLAYSSLSGVQSLQPDGGFFVDSLPPGPLHVQVNDGGVLLWDALPGSFLPDRRPSGRRPEGIEVDREFEFVLASGEELDVELDLRSRSSCTLTGALGLQRADPPRLYISDRRHLYASLLTASGAASVGRGQILADGSFTIHAERPGDYILHVDFDGRGGYRMILDVPVHLEAGRNDWAGNWSRGDLRVLTGHQLEAGPYLGAWALERELGVGGSLRIELPRPGAEMQRKAPGGLLRGLPSGTYTVPMLGGVGALEPVLIRAGEAAHFPPDWR